MKTFKKIAFALVLTGMVQSANAQFLKKLGERAQKAAERTLLNKTDKKVSEKVGKSVDDVVDGKNKKTSKTNKENPEGLQANDGSGMGEIGKNYDFVPGEQILFETNFSKTVIGNFPRNLEFRGGELSVVSYSGGRSIAASTKGSSFAIKLSEKLPERFTIEFKEFNSEFVNSMQIQVVDDNFKPVGQHYIALDGYSERSGVGAYKREDITSLHATGSINERMMPIRVMVDGSYVKLYVGTKRIANMPNANLGRSNTLLFKFAVRNKPIYVSDIRIAAGGRSLYQALESTGRVAIHDIHFATGKATILPESSETIGNVAKLLQDHPELKLLIEGHTDNTGSFEKNMQLSKERAASVKIYLIEKFKIDESRLETMGLGQSHPTADNDTAEGKAENRRVEIVKL